MRINLLKDEVIPSYDVHGGCGVEFYSGYLLRRCREETGIPYNISMGGSSGHGNRRDDSERSSVGVENPRCKRMRWLIN